MSNFNSDHKQRLQVPYINEFLDRSWKQIILHNIRRTNLGIKLIEIRHMSRPKFFYLGSLNSISKHVFSNVCGLHMIVDCHLNFHVSPNMLLGSQGLKLLGTEWSSHSVWWRGFANIKHHILRTCWHGPSHRGWGYNVGCNVSGDPTVTSSSGEGQTTLCCANAGCQWGTPILL